MCGRYRLSRAEKLAEYFEAEQNGLTSAELKFGDPVEAVVTMPIFTDGNRLVLPQGSRLKGSVTKAVPAKRFGRNGELRFSFKQIELPTGAKLRAAMDVKAATTSDSNMRIDDEGATHASQSSKRYLAPIMFVALTNSVGEDDNGFGTTAAAAGGFGIIGRVLALSSGSRPMAYGIAYYGLARSIYAHFIARGHDVVFPANTQIELSMGKR